MVGAEGVAGGLGGRGDGGLLVPRPGDSTYDVLAGDALGLGPGPQGAEAGVVIEQGFVAAGFGEAG